MVLFCPQRCQLSSGSNCISSRERWEESRTEWLILTQVFLHRFDEALVSGRKGIPLIPMRNPAVFCKERPSRLCLCMNFKATIGRDSYFLRHPIFGWILPHAWTCRDGHNYKCWLAGTVHESVRRPPILMRSLVHP